jgi:tRNA A58 N-methylase Trm61
LLLRNDRVVEYGAGHAKVTVSFGLIAGVNLEVVGFERDSMQYGVSLSVLEQAPGLGIENVNSHGVMLIVEA